MKKCTEFTAAELATLFSALRLYQHYRFGDTEAESSSGEISPVHMDLFPTHLNRAGFGQLFKKLDQRFIEHMEPWIFSLSANSSSVRKHGYMGEISVTTAFGETTQYGPYAIVKTFNDEDEEFNSDRCIACGNTMGSGTWAGLCASCADLVHDDKKVANWVASSHGIHFDAQCADVQHILRVRYIRSTKREQGAF